MVTVLLLSAIIPPLVVFSFGGGRDVLETIFHDVPFPCWIVVL